MLTLPEKLIAVHDALVSRDIRHAFGGALALAYYVGNPRATNDIDVNVAVPVNDARRVLSALPPGVVWDETSVSVAQRDGQVRVHRAEDVVWLDGGIVPWHHGTMARRTVLLVEILVVGRSRG